MRQRFVLHCEVNHRHWAQQNPKVMQQTHTQYPEKLNVWAGILGEHIVSPFFIEGTLDGEKYLDLSSG